jgi:DNA-binding beta-propeller fold protein YncE
VAPFRSVMVAGGVALVLGCTEPASEGETNGASETASTESSTSTETETETETGSTETSDTEGDPPRPDRLVVTADWRAKRLSLLDYASLRDGATTRDAALWKSIELPDHEPGPIEVELTPDGSLAVVAVGPGFFAGTGAMLVGLDPEDVPVGGALLVVEIDSGTIVAELATAQYPLGIAITPDGSTAFTANFGGNGQNGTTMSVVDLGSFTITEEIEIGSGLQQLDLSADGSLGIINTGTAIRMFATANPSASLSPAVPVSDDPSGVLLLEDGMDRAVAINSLGPPGYSVLDVADPSLPVVVDTIAVPGVPYATAPGRTPTEILVPVFTGITMSLQMFDVDTGEVVEQIDVPITTGLPLGVVFEPTDEIAMVPVPGTNAMIVADFTSLDYTLIDWQAEVGPTYLALE